MAKRILALAIALAMAAGLAVVLTGCGNGNDNGQTTAQTSPQAPPTANDATPQAGLTLGDTITFDGLEIRFGDEFGWTTVGNQFNEHFGEDVFTLPIYITNISGDTNNLSLNDVTLFGPDGNRLPNLAPIMNDIWTRSMRDGATLEATMSFLYAGDGQYVVEFYDWWNRVEVLFNLER